MTNSELQLPATCIPREQVEYNANVDSLDSSPTYRRHAIQAQTPAMKEWFDRLAAAVLLIPGIPLIAILILLIRATSKGPGVYKQLRTGRNGSRFTMYKLRSMRIDAEAATGAVWASLGADARVTPLGYWLRRLHLDELPQLFNVLVGDMALVGPRPERPEFVSVLESQIEGYCDRLAIKPGITGLAQINLPADTDLDSVRDKLCLDREYIQEESILLDVRIIACTLFRLIGLRNGRAVQLFGLRRTVKRNLDTCDTSSTSEKNSSVASNVTVRVIDIANAVEPAKN